MTTFLCSKDKQKQFSYLLGFTILTVFKSFVVFLQSSVANARKLEIYLSILEQGSENDSFPLHSLSDLSFRR
jgi:hypothetical protein